MRQFEQIFTDTDREVLRKAGFAKKQHFGEHPTLLLIDMITSFIGATRKPILKSIDEFPTSCGEAGWDSATATKKLLKSCRAGAVPVVYVTGDAHYRQFTRSPVKGMAAGTPSIPKFEEIFPPLAPLSTELVIRKTKASAFFGTPLAGCLRDMGTDTLLFAGCTTSGCVRASVVDAYNEGFKCFVVEECVFDRFPLSHLVNLWDLNAKYADVVQLDDTIKYINDWGK